LQRVKGVVSAKADFASKTAVVSYDPGVTGPQALIRATTDAGFPSTVRK
jgi:mercuric ion binding protein